MQRVGGQALLNGILMMGERTVIIIRRSDGSYFEKIYENKVPIKNFRIPVIRGIIFLAKQLFLGLYAMIKSIFLSERKFSMLFLLLLIVIASFYSFFIDLSDIFPNFAFIVDYFILLLLIFIISKNRGVKNILMMHGAEHKVVHCYENGIELTLENVKKFPKEHMRCGTSLVVFIMLIIVIYDVLSALFLGDGFYSEILDIALIPVFLGIAYEISVLSVKNSNKKIFKYANEIGIILQKLTTKEPMDEQIEIAIKALKKAI